MTPQERQLVDDLFGRLSRMEGAPRDSDATAAIAQGLRSAPNAIYPLVQTVLLQDEALRRANDRIQELENQSAPQQNQGGGFLDTMRGALFGQGQSQGGQSQGSVPNVRPPEVGSRPVWNSGQVLQQTGHYDQGGYGQRDQGGYGQPYGGPQGPGGGMMGGGMMGGGGGGSFLGTAAASAAGVIGGSLLLNSIRGMMGGGHQAAFGGTSSQSPWTDQSNSSLARDAGVNDISSRDLAAQDRAQDLAQDQEDDDLRAQDERDDMEADANDDFGGNDDSDFA
jgi:uncharacterized protein